MAVAVQTPQLQSALELCRTAKGKSVIAENHFKSGAPLFVEHSTYGCGSVLSLTKTGESFTLEILFDEPISGTANVRRILDCSLHANSLSLAVTEMPTGDRQSDGPKDLAEENLCLPPYEISVGDFIATTVQNIPVVLEIEGFDDSPTGSRMLVAFGHSARIGVCRIPFDGRAVEVFGDAKAFASIMVGDEDPRELCQKVSNSAYLGALREEGAFNLELYLQGRLMSRGRKVRLERDGTTTDLGVVEATSNTEKREICHGFDRDELEAFRDSYHTWLQRKRTSSDTPDEKKVATKEPPPSLLPSDLAKVQKPPKKEEPVLEITKPTDPNDNKFGVYGRLIFNRLAAVEFIIDPSQARRFSDIIVAKKLNLDRVVDQYIATKDKTTLDKFLGAL